jgi:hypothetical protein
MCCGGQPGRARAYDSNGCLVHAWSPPTPELNLPQVLSVWLIRRRSAPAEVTLVSAGAGRRSSCGGSDGVPVGSGVLDAR